MTTGSGNRELLPDGERSEPDRIARAQQALLRQKVRALTQNAGPPPGSTRIPRRTADGPAPLSLAQRQLWYLSQLSPESVAYNELAVVHKNGPLNVGALRAAFNEFVRRHEIWRTTFALVDAEPRQIVHDLAEFPLPLLDLSHLPSDGAELQADALAAADAERPFDLTAGPLLRPRLVRLSQDQHRLYLGLHHLIFDGVTLYRILLKEIVPLYDAYANGLPSPLPEPAVQYADYSVWELASLEKPAVAVRVDWWRKTLAGLTPLELPSDYPRPARQRFVGGAIPLTVERRTAERLREIAHRSGATVFQVFATLFAFWLSQYTGRDDVAFATMNDLRQRPELIDMPGYCVTPVVLRTEVSPGLTFIQLLDRVSGQLLDSLDNMVSFERLVREIGGHRDPRMNPIFQAALVLEPAAPVPDPNWSLDIMQVASRKAAVHAKFDLSIELDERPEGHIDGRLVYDSALFESSSAQQMKQHWMRLIEAAAAAPTRQLDQLELVSDSARRRDHATRNPAPVSAESPCIHDLIGAQAARTPEAIAVVCGQRQLTYRELERSAAAVAARLSEAGAGPSSIVATVLERSVDLVVGLLGVLMSGAAYLPLDPRHPAARLAYEVQDSGAAVLLTCSALVAALPDFGAPVVTLDTWYRPADEIRLARVGGTDLAYVIYTSGSTGRPKGVLVEHRNVTHLMTTMFQKLGVSSADTVVSVASYTFDMSVADIFCALGLGARVLLASNEAATNHRVLAKLLNESAPTVMAATPTTWSGLLTAGWNGSPRLVAIAGGEPLPDSLARAMTQRCRAVWNGYGPTESTVYATCGPVRCDEPISVGVAVPGIRIYVLDRYGQLIPDGVPGEVVIGGPGVARGYLNQPEETALRFADDPFVAGGRMYRTGDRGRFLADGRLQLLGRLDSQLKVRGFRIEPGEIEATLLEHPDVAAAAVAAKGSTAEDRRIVAYIVAGTDAARDWQLRAWLRSRLPDYMVPNVIVRLRELPRTSSGKIDRAALPDPPMPSTGAATRDEGRFGTATQDRLAAMWSDVLRTDVVDPDIDFFDLGGHSLLATRLIAEVELHLGAQVSLVDFLERGTTIAGLAELVDMSQHARPGKNGAAAKHIAAPLFFVYPDMATAVSMRHFRAVFGPAQPLFPLLPHQTRGQFDRSVGIEAMAGTMLREIRQEQHRGPYALGGYSLGGLVAYEIARQLAEHGERVRWLGILDSPTPQLFRSWQAPSARFERLRTQSLPDQWQKCVKEVRVVAGMARRLFVQGQAAPVTTRTGFDYRGALAVSRRYLRPGHDSALQLFLTEGSVTMFGDETLGWADFHQGPLQVHTLPGDHDALLRASPIEQVAQLFLAGHKDAGTYESIARHDP